MVPAVPFGTSGAQGKGWWEGTEGRIRARRSSRCRGAAAARLPWAAGLASPARRGTGRAWSRTTGPCPLLPRCTAAAALGLTSPPAPSCPPASFQWEAASSGTKPGSSHPTRALPSCPQPGSRRSCCSSAGTTGRAAPLSLLHYCHGRSEQCNNERASVRRGAARAGDEPVTARGDGTSRRPPRATLTGRRGYTRH